MEYLVVDGYNIINAWPELVKIAKEDLESARKKLIEIMGNYQGYNKVKVIVVFDAHLVKGSMEKVESYGGVDVVYTKSNETADNYIEKTVEGLVSTGNVRVATSDFLEQTIILGKGASRLSARELLGEVKSVKKRMPEKYGEKLVKTNTIGSQLDGNVLETLEKLRRQKF